MSLARQLIRELEEEPELAALLARKLELTLSIQILKNIEELREDFNKILARVENVEKEQVRLADEQRRLANEQIRLAQEQARLREDFNRMLARLEKVEKRVDDVWGAVLWGFNQVSNFAGVNFEEFLRKLLTRQLRKAGILAPGVKLMRSVVEGEEINLFCEEPLVVGEITAHTESIDEVLKLLRKVKVVENKYSKPVARKILIILTAPRRVAREIEKLCREHDIELVIGRRL